MIITHIKIQNIRGIENLEFDCGLFNEITGDNGTGKSSIQDAIRWALRPKNTHDRTMLRNGAAMGTVEIAFDNGGKLISTVTSESSTQDFVGKKHAGKYLSEISDIMAINPVMFVLATPDKRLQYLLETVPFNLDWKALGEIVGEDIKPTDDPLGMLEYQHDQIYKERTRINTLKDDRESSYKDLTRSLPDEDPVSPEEKKSTLVAQKNELTSARDTKIKDTESKNTDYQKQCEKERDDAIEAAKQACQTKVDKANARVKQITTEANTEYQASVSPIDTELGKVEESIRNYDTIKSLRLTVATKKREWEEYQKESQLLTEAINGIKDLKKKVLADFPIDGVEIISGNIYVNDIPFDTLNEAQQLEFAHRITSLRLESKELQLIRMDGMEKYSDTTYEAFKQSALKNNVQHFISRVAPHPLSVSAINPN